jgi:hypothetical protein
MALISPGVQVSVIDETKQMLQEQVQQEVLQRQMPEYHF